MRPCKGYRLGYRYYRSYRAAVTGKARQDVVLEGVLPK